MEIKAGYKIIGRMVMEIPKYYTSVMTTARKLASEKQAAGLASFSGQEAVEKFQRLSKTGTAVEDSKATLEFIDANGRVTRNPQNAVAVLVHEASNPAAHLYFRERFDQPLTST